MLWAEGIALFTVARIYLVDLEIMEFGRSALGHQGQAAADVGSADGEWLFFTRDPAKSSASYSVLPFLGISR